MAKTLSFKNLFAALIVCTATMLQGCGDGGGEGGSGALAVANGFWRNLISPHPDSALPYVMDKQTASLSFNGYAPGDQYEFISHKEENGIIALYTNLYLNRGGEMHTVPIKTILVQHGGAWLVDYESTKLSLYDAVIEHNLNSISGMMITGVNALESEMPQFRGKKDKELLKELGNYSASLSQELYDAINNARISASAARGQVNDSAVKQRQELLEGTGK